MVRDDVARHAKISAHHAEHSGCTYAILQTARYPNPDALLTQFADARGPSGAPHESALPSGTLTFLFTDIAGSTTRWERQPQAMERALARHDDLLRQAIDAYGGHVVKT